MIGPEPILRQVVLALILIPAFFAPVAGQRSPLCRDWQDCRRLALEAKERGEVDRFHDLAWAASQAGPKNDPDLLYLVARAQALSGRPHNAVVMLKRLTDAGFATDADTDPDFEQPRLVPEWPEVGAAIARVRSSSPAGAAVLTAPARPAPVPAGALPSVPVVPVNAGSFSTAAPAAFVSAGLAYDVVSRRFVVGDTLGRKLLVVATGATHSDDLVRMEAGFGDVAAIGIDERRGVLWVAGGSSPAGEGRLQRLQLVSGRALSGYRAQAVAGQTRMIDLAVLDSGDVIALDAAGNRLLSLASGSTELTVTAPLKLSGVTSLARRSDSLLYVAHDAGIARVDLRTRAVSPVSPPKGMELGRFETIRMHRNTLIGLQAAAGGSRTLVRLNLDAAGGAVTEAAVLDSPSFKTDRRLSLAISGDDLYYLVGDAPDPQTASAPNPAAPGTEFVIRRITLR